MLPEDVNKSSYKFSKRERITSTLAFSELIASNTTLFLFPIKCYYRSKDVDSDVYHSVAFSVPKRNFKSAVKRNRLKRLMREVYRQNKAILTFTREQYNILFLYIGKDVLPYKQIEWKMIQLLKWILQRDQNINEND